MERIHNAERVNDMKQSMIDRLNELGGQGKPFVFCLDYEMSELILLEEPLAQQELLFDIGGVTNSLARSVSDTPAVLQVTPISEEAYAERFAVIRHALELLRQLDECTLEIHYTEQITPAMVAHCHEDSIFADTNDASGHT